MDASLLREFAESLTQPIYDWRAIARSATASVADLEALRNKILELSKVDADTSENLNEVPSERPGGDQQSEETPRRLRLFGWAVVTKTGEPRQYGYLRENEARELALDDDREHPGSATHRAVPLFFEAYQQQGENDAPTASRTLLHRQLFPAPDETLHPIPAGATHYALRRLVDGPAVDFWGLSSTEKKRSESPLLAMLRGKVAFAHGFNRSAAPYEPGPLADAWLAGWEEAREAARSRK